MIKTPGSFLIVFIQLGCIFFLMKTGSIIPSNSFLLVIEIILFVFGIWAMIEMNLRFNIFPELLKNSNLITSGPYRYIRNPMYSATIFITLIWIINESSYLRLAVWILLVIILNIKLTYEEKILLKEFPNYTEYKMNSKKLIPFIF